MAAPLLNIRGIAAGYGAVTVLHGISLTLEAGHNLAILGPNGSGKTTLLRCIAGDLAPSQGQIELSGIPSDTLARTAISRKVAASSCEHYRPPAFSVLQYVLLGRYPWLSWLGMYRERDYAIAHKALQVCGISQKANEKLEALSSGQWQLAVLARTLVQAWGAESPILALDEISANLDIAKRLEVFQLLKFWCNQGSCIIQSIHDCNLAAMFCTHLLGIKEGRQLFFGPVSHVFTTENLNALYDCQFGIFQQDDLSVPQVYVRPGPLHFTPHLERGWRNLR